MKYRLAVVNPIMDIKKNVGKFVISNAIAYSEDGKQLGKIAAPGQLPGIPLNVDYPKNILQLQGNGTLIDYFQYGEGNYRKLGAIIECIVDDNTNEGEYILTFTLDKNSSLRTKKGINALIGKKVFIENTGKYLSLQYEGKEISTKEIKNIKDNIYNCNAFIYEIDALSIKIIIRGLNDSRVVNQSYNIDFKSLYPEIFAYVKDKLEPFFINKLFNSYRDYTQYKNYICKPKYLYIDTDNLIKVAVTSILRNKNLLLIGPKSTGKNVFIETLSWIFQRPMMKVSVCNETDKYDLIGSTVLVNEKTADGSVNVVTKYEEHALIQCMRLGFILVLDEVNTADSGLMTALNSVLDDSKSYLLQSGEKVESDSNFITIGTLNEGYVGTKELHKGFLDRFINIRFKYSDSIIPILSEGRSDVIDNKVKILLESIYKELIVSIEKKILDPDCISIRAFKNALDFIDDGFSYNDALTLSLVNISDEFSRDKIKEIINSYC